MKIKVPVAKAAAMDQKSAFDNPEEMEAVMEAAIIRARGNGGSAPVKACVDSL
jgi:hypothetical protein